MVLSAAFIDSLITRSVVGQSSGPRCSIVRDHTRTVQSAQGRLARDGASTTGRRHLWRAHIRRDRPLHSSVPEQINAAPK